MRGDGVLPLVAGAEHAQPNVRVLFKAVLLCTVVKALTNAIDIVVEQNNFIRAGESNHVSVMEFSKGATSRVRFRATPVIRNVSRCVYRSAQKALHNVAKRPVRRAKRWCISVSDSGIGFDVGDSQQQIGLGLVSVAYERPSALSRLISVD